MSTHDRDQRHQATSPAGEPADCGSHHLESLIHRDVDNTDRVVTLTRLVEFLEARGRSPLEATREDFDGFEEDVWRRLTSRQRKGYRAWLRDLYRSAFAAGHVTMAVALAAGVDPLEVSPDRERLAFAVREHGGACATALRVLAEYFAGRECGPLTATPEGIRAFRATGMQHLTASSRKTYRRWIQTFYTAEGAAGRVPLAVAVAAGADALELSPDRRHLRAFAQRRADASDAPKAVRALAEFFARREKGPLAATPQELGEFYADFEARFAATTVKSYGWLIRAFYRDAFDEDLISLQIAVAARVDALEISPDRQRLAAFAADHADALDCAASLRLLAEFLGARGKGPLAAEPDELEMLSATALKGLARRTAGGRRTWIAAFYRQLWDEEQVSPAVAVAAGVDALEVSPDRDVLRSFIDAQPDANAVPPLRFLADFFARRNEGPLGGNPIDLGALESLMRSQFTSSTFKEYRRWIREFYRTAFTWQQTSVAVAVSVGMDPLDVSPDGASLRAFGATRGDSRRSETALRMLARYFALREKGPLGATADQLEAFWCEALTVGDPDAARAYKACIRGFYRAAFEDNWPSPRFAVVAGADPLAVSPDAEILQAFVAERVDQELCATALRLLARHFTLRGRGVVGATTDDLRVFFAEAFRPLARATRRKYRAWIGAFYAEQHLRGRVAPLVAIAAGADPVTVSPDRELLEAFLEQRHSDRWRRPALRRLAAFFARRAKGVLEAAPDELELLDGELQRGVEVGTAAQLRRVIGMFYAAALNEGRVTLDVAVAARAAGLQISPDRETLRAFLAERRGNLNCALGLERLARFFARHGKGPLAATVDELAACYATAFRDLSHETRTVAQFWVREFYAEQYGQGRISRVVAVTAGVLGPQLLDES